MIKAITKCMQKWSPQIKYYMVKIFAATTIYKLNITNTLSKLAGLTELLNPCMDTEVNKN